MTDMNRAGLLEILAGKTRSNTAAAILSNTKDLEEAYKSAMEAEGSALEENEKYLDSIQGRIDLFNNAVQTMWNNALDSSVVKGIVDLGTRLIKIVDTLGLIPSILAAIGATKGLKLLFKSFTNAALPIKTIWTYINELTIGFKGFTLAQMKANATTAAGHLVNSQYANGLIRTNLIQWLTQKSTQALENAKYQLKLAEMGLKNGVAHTSDVIAAQAAVQAASIPVDYAKMTTVQLLGASFKQLMASVWGATKAIAAFLFTNPIGWVILAIGAIAGGIAIYNKIHKTTEELTEELSNLKSELADIQSEIDSLNTELETTQNRIAELLAMDSLSFTEQEELSNLQKQNEELQRRIDLLELQEKVSQEKAAKTFVKLMKRDIKSVNERIQSNEVNWWDEGGFNNFEDDKGNEEAYIEDRLYKYQMYQKEAAELASQIIDVGGEDTKEGKKLAKQKKKIDKWLGETREYLDGKIREFNERSDGLEYFTGDNLTDEQKASNQWLDYIRNVEDKWAIVAGGQNAKTNAIKRIFNKEEFKDVSEEIDTLVKKYNQTGDVTILDEISAQANKAKEDIDAVGLSVRNVVDYFTLESSGFNSDTFDGVLNQYAQGNEVLHKMMSSTNFQQDWGKFFTQDDEGKFKARADKFGEILQGMDEDARKTFIGVVESAVNSADDLNSIDWSKAISSFNVSGILAATKVIEAQFAELSKSIFKGLDDEISGFIDTFGELSSALEDVASSMDLLDTAQKQFKNSGQISVKTALELIESTDRWDEVLTFTNGTIGLTSDAEDVLVQSKLNVIKANIDEALTSAQLQLQQLGTADSTLYAAGATDVTSEAYGIYHDAMNSYTASIAAFGAAIDALMSGNITGVFSSAKSAYDASKQITTSQDEASAEELRKRIKDLQAQKSLIEKVGTTSAFKNNYDFDKTPGDKSDDSAADAFQKEMEYWENRIGANQAKYEQIQNEIDLLEKKGQIAGKEYYEEQMILEGQRLHLLGQQKAEAEKFLGTFKEGSDEWWEVANTLNDLEGEMDDVRASIQDLSDAMAEVDWYIFDETHERLNNLHDDLNAIRDLIAPNGEGDWFDDEGMWTDSGVAYLGSYVQDLAFYEEQLEDVNKKLNEQYHLPYDGNEDHYKALGIDSEQELYDAREKLLDQQQEYLTSISDTKQSVVDMYEAQIDAIEEWADEAVEAYNDYIDVVKESLDAERDLYEFKKDIQKQTKDITTLERRIASLSGSTDASDIAERRKLEAELYEAKEGLNDTYYGHAKDAQSEALDDESEAYEESMTNYIDTLREKLDAATLNMTLFMEQVTTAVVTNAGIVLTKYGETGLKIDEALTTPWANAQVAMKDFEGEQGLGLMNSWTKQGGAFDQFKQNATPYLQQIWKAGTSAAGQFQIDTAGVMSKVVSNITSNVSTAVGELNKIKNLYKEINDTKLKPPVVTPPAQDPPSTVQPGGQTEQYRMVKQGTTAPNESVVLGSYAEVDGVKYYKLQGRSNGWVKNGSFTTKGSNKGYVYEGTYWYQRLAKYAKGTTSTTQDQWAITDEPWLGDELTMYATKQGTLSYMRAGSTVIPADLTKELMTIGEIGLDGLTNMPKFDSGISLMSNVINKPELNLSFEALVKADKITEDTLPEVKKFVTQELDNFARKLNYSLKKVGAY
jgi:uncharacterized membrane-anchored protein YhcB (DUF1043 family)